MASQSKVAFPGLDKGWPRPQDDSPRQALPPLSCREAARFRPHGAHNTLISGTARDFCPDFCRAAPAQLGRKTADPHSALLPRSQAWFSGFRSHSGLLAFRTSSTTLLEPCHHPDWGLGKKFASTSWLPIWHPQSQNWAKGQIRDESNPRSCFSFSFRLENFDFFHGSSSW